MASPGPYLSIPGGGFPFGALTNSKPPYFTFPQPSFLAHPARAQPGPGPRPKPGPKFWEDQNFKMKNAARACPRKFIWRPMCQNRIFQILAQFWAQGPGSGPRQGRTRAGPWAGPWAGPFAGPGPGLARARAWARSRARAWVRPGPGPGWLGTWPPTHLRGDGHPHI